ncbi:MAG: hypothetical protein U1D29_14360 [Burkholderiales bacterium]|nr:hypothetical protein [Burkholderiales bacterium]
MTPQAIFADLLAQGVELKLATDGANLIVPAGSLSPEQRALVLANKPALIAYLIEAQRLTVRLIAAAMRRCDQFNDSEAARQAMRDDCLATPPELRQDLLDHFQGKAPGDS